MSKQRPRGSGTIYQQENGKWVGQLQVNGRRQTVRGQTKAEVKHKLDQLKHQAMVQGGLPEKQTLFVLLDRFLEVGQSGWKPRTVEDYRRVVTVIKEQLGDVPLAKLTPSRIQSLYLACEKSRRRALYLHQILHRAFNLAVRWGWLFSNPCDRVIRPGYRKEERELWTVDQCRTFIEGTRDSDWYPLFTTAILTGCRFGELAGMRWKDIDTDQRTIYVHRTLQKIGKEWIEGVPKTKAGKRLIHIDDMALDALRQQKKLQAERQLRATQWENADGRVFTNQNGGPLSESAAIHSLSRHCKNLGLPEITLHSFRHLNASLALQAGAPIALVSKQLGHANVSITASIYSHALTDGGLVSAALKKALES